MARLPHNQLSQTPRAIKWRTQKAEADAAWMAAQESGERANPESYTLEPSRIPIGVFSEPGRPEPEPQEYHCQHCKTPVVPSNHRCRGCQRVLDWDAVHFPA